MFNLTRDERRAILFLGVLALVGAGIDFLVKVNSQARAVVCIREDIGRVNLNRADKQTLMSVKGIGEKLAGRIIEYREQQSGFKDPEELKNIKGINLYRYEKIKDSFFVK